LKPADRTAGKHTRGLVESYGTYITIEKNAEPNAYDKNLAAIYGIFLAAALLEAAFINALTMALRLST